MVRHNYYKNVVSIVNSFDKKKVGFHLTERHIEEIANRVRRYERNRKSEKPVKYFAREDIAFVLKYMLHKNVYWISRGANLNFKERYEKEKRNKKIDAVLFETPAGFPVYKPFM
jgi:hypothetical protein